MTLLLIVKAPHRLFSHPKFHRWTGWRIRVKCRLASLRQSQIIDQRRAGYAWNGQTPTNRYLKEVPADALVPGRRYSFADTTGLPAFLDRNGTARLVLLFSLEWRLGNYVETYFSAKQSPSRKDAWIPRADGDEKWTPGIEAPSREGSQTVEPGALLISPGWCLRTRICALQTNSARYTHMVDYMKVV